MGGLLQFFDFNHVTMSRKFLMHKKYNDGLEAPRNSLDFPMEASQSYHDIPEDIPVKHHSAKMNSFPDKAPMKKLIDQDMSTRKNDKCNRPSVVARLMGLEMLPSEIEPIRHARDRKDEKPMSRKNPTEIVSAHKTSLISTPFKQTSLPYDIEQDFSQSTKSLKLRKPQSREHPQEEELQKFKKEFEARESSRIGAHSRTIESGNDLKQGNMQILAKENCSREKKARLMDAKRNLSFKETTKPKHCVSRERLKTDTLHGGVLTNGAMTEQRQVVSRNDIALRNNAKTNLKRVPLANFDATMDGTSSPANIVILKPSSERSYDIEESLVSSPERMEKANDMQNFLEEVRKRLNSEIQGKTRYDTTARWTSADNYSSRRSIDPKQIARDITKQIRESVANDFMNTLAQSESTKSYRSEVQFHGPNSPEFLKRETRELLSERLKNVLRNEIDIRIPLTANGSSGTSLSRKEAMRLRPTYDLSKKGKKEMYWEDKKTLTESKTTSFRHEYENSAAFDSEAVSPRSLVRSFSAPVSGTAYGNLLFEDQHLLIGVHIFRKHEACLHTSEEIRRNKKDGFNFKGRVSNLKGKFFGKKIQSMDKMADNGIASMKAALTAPPVVLNTCVAQENSTEVPPTPASVSSSLLDEIPGPGYPSPVSPLEAPFTEDCTSSQDFGEPCSELPVTELKSLLEDKNNAPKEVATEGRPDEDEPVEAEDPAKAFIRDVLLTSGLYEGQPYDQVFSRWTHLTKPISQWVFEKVEESYDKNRKVNDESLHCNGNTNAGYKMLFDLINEALPRVMQKPMAGSTARTWILGPQRLLHGKKLLDSLWCQIEIHMNSQSDASYSLDSIVAWDLTMTPWPGVFHEDINIIGRKMECIILRELIDEFVWDICF